MDNDGKIKEKAVIRATLVGSIVNLLLTAVKFVAGVVGHSSAMMADAIHSLSDLVTDAIVVVFVRISGKPQDSSHDYGHGKYETMAALAIGLILGLVGIGVMVDGIELVVRACRGEVLPRPGMIALIVALLAIIAKEWLYHYTVRVARKVNSPAAEANAWHHRSDAFSSIGTLVGIAGAMFLGESWRVLDPIAAILVSLFIIKVSWDICRPCVDELLEKSLPEETEDEIAALLIATPGVVRIHHLRTRRIGSNIAIEVHLKMAGDMSLYDAHAIASDAERRLREKYGAGTHVGIHMEPA